MARERVLGEFEHLVLLAVLRHPAGVIGSHIGRELEARAGRRVSRGALYSALDRLEAKGCLRWTVEAGVPERGGHPPRRFVVTRTGRAALRVYHRAVNNLLAGVAGRF
ncbi:MAG TPA: helix-turn-helix transcriptional regulator [Vicinamibacterales bacterium]|nr:helix-turn-helix transcriptional regulator [Vicinamibacterales bacterium]